MSDCLALTRSQAIVGQSYVSCLKPVFDNVAAFTAVKVYVRTNAAVPKLEGEAPSYTVLKSVPTIKVA